LVAIKPTFNYVRYANPENADVKFTVTCVLLLYVTSPITIVPAVSTTVTDGLPPNGWVIDQVGEGEP